MKLTASRPRPHPGPSPRGRKRHTRIRSHVRAVQIPLARKGGIHTCTNGRRPRDGDAVQTGPARSGAAGSQVPVTIVGRHRDSTKWDRAWGKQVSIAARSRTCRDPARHSSNELSAAWPVEHLVTRASARKGRRSSDSPTREVLEKSTSTMWLPRGAGTARTSILPLLRSCLPTLTPGLPTLTGTLPDPSRTLACPLASTLLNSVNDLRNPCARQGDGCRRKPETTRNQLFDRRSHQRRHHPACPAVFSAKVRKIVA